ncbi:MAG: hypothetical protein Q8Q25_03455 [bacterium]|nr:hypothetical protein [bacterium]
MESELDQQPTKSMTLQLKEWEELVRQEQRANEPKGIGTIVIATSATVLRNQSVHMNSAVFTLITTAFYEFIRVKNTAHKFSMYQFPIASNRFNKRFEGAFHGGLYANIFNALLGGKEWTYITQKYMHTHNPPIPINGWKIIGSYMIIDLGSRYCWDVIKNFRLKFVENGKVKTAPTKKEKKQHTSQLKSMLDWSAKTVLVTLIVNALR